MGITKDGIQAVFESLPGAYLILRPDAPRFTITAVSDAYASATMTKREEIVGRGLFEVFPDNPDEPEATGVANLTASLNKVLKHKKPHKMAIQKYDIPRPAGGFEERYWSPVNTPVFGKRGEVAHIVHSVVDVTKAIKLAEKQEQSEREIDLLRQRHNLLFEQDYVAITVFRGPDYIIEQANPTVCRIWGRTRKQVVGKPLFEALPEIKGQGLEELLGGVMTSGKYFIGEELPVKIRRRGKLDTVYFDFVYVPMRDEDGTIAGITVLATDASAQVQARQRVEDSEKRLRFMAESMPQKIFTAKPNGEVDYFNPQWLEFTGLTFDEMSEWGWTKLVHPADVDENIRRWQHSIETGEPFEFEHRFRRTDGEYRWHLSRAQAMRDDKGKIVMWVGSNTDIEDVRRNQELEKMTEILKQQRSQLLALNQSKDEFISLASHQLRTPATGVKQYIRMLLEGYAGELAPEQLSLLEIADESNERQITIIEDLLKVARADAGKVILHKAKLDLVGLIGDVLDEQRSKFDERKQDVSFRPLVKKLYVHADKAHIRMALENLIDNAGKYTPTGKKITVKVRKDPAKRSAVIVIKDQGVGVSEQDLPRLFQKFVRIDNPLSIAVGGSGLGLYWTKKIIDLHKGSITLTSAVDKGSSFKVALPL